MGSIPEKWREAALQFALDLSQEGENFPKKVLILLDKHFGFRRSIFFPHQNPPMGSFGQKRPGALSNYVTYGLSYGPMVDYKERVYKDDLFRYSRLPLHLRGQRVVFTDDIMPIATFEETPFGAHMAAIDMVYQACIFLYSGGKVVASIALLRARQEGQFQQEDRALLQYLGDLLEASYQGYLHQSGEAKVAESFQLFFQDMRQGAVLLNQEMSVVQANQMAKDQGRLFWSQFRSSQGHFLRSNYQGEEQYREVQTMVNELGEKLGTHGSGGLVLSSTGGEMTFYHSAFLSAGVTGAIQTWHLLTILSKAKELPSDQGHPYNSLTQQERRIAYFLSTGTRNEQIAEELHISIYTVRTHIANIYKKFEVGNKVDLLMCLQPYLKETMV